MRAESTYVLEQAGVEAAEELVETARKATARDNELKHMSSNFQLYYQILSNATITRLSNLYAFDCHVLGYPTTPFKKLKSASL